MRIEYDQLAPAEWDALADSANALLQQRWAYGDAMRSHGRKVSRAVIWDGGRPIGLAQILHRNFLWTGFSLCLAGPVWLAEIDMGMRCAVLRQLSRNHPNRGPLIVIPRDSGDMAGTGLVPVMGASTLALLDLSVGRNKMRASLKGKWRNRMVRAEASGLRIKEERASPDRLAHILAIEAKQRDIRSYRGIPLPFLRTLSQMNNCQMRLFSAYDDGSLCAQMLHAVHGQTATYLAGWTDEKGRGLSAHHLILWRSMCAFCERGISQIDLGTINTVEAPGLARFKLGTGAKAHQMGGAWARPWPRFGLPAQRAPGPKSLAQAAKVHLTTPRNNPKPGAGG